MNNTTPDPVLIPPAERGLPPGVVASYPVAAQVNRADGHPLLFILSAFPVAGFIGALGTDVAYAASADIMWADFSDWLLFAGILLGVPAFLIGAISLVASRRIRPQRPGALILGSIVVLVLGFFNNLVHSRDGWTSVVPVGVGLSALTVVAILFTAFVGAPRLIRPVAVVEPRE